MIDKKGILSYLIITFTITYLIEFILILKGLRFSEGITGITSQVSILGVMFVPSLSAFITIQFITKEGFSSTGLRFGSIRAYLYQIPIILLGFIFIYAFTWLLGLGEPDWKLIEFTSSISKMTGTNIPLPLPASTFILILFVSTTLFAPIFNGIIAFGEEFGWRGYLLPKLMPLGKAKAYIILGLAWGVWHFPLLLVGFNYPGARLYLSIPVFILLTFMLSIYINEISLHYRSSFIASWLHGIFNSYGLGVWSIVFINVNPILGGCRGIIGIVVLSILGVCTLYYYKSKPLPAAKSGS